VDEFPHVAAEHINIRDLAAAEFEGNRTGPQMRRKHTTTADQFYAASEIGARTGGPKLQYRELVSLDIVPKGIGILFDKA
jgi:hypothetical protein